MSHQPSPETRRRPTYLTGERELLEGWLEFHRATLLEKCRSLSPSQLRYASVSPSVLSLHGLIRHLAETERNWFGRILEGDLTRPAIWAMPDDADRMVPPETAAWDADIRAWIDECEASRNATSRYSLDDAGTWREHQVTLRSILLHMIQEYARHNGHADLIRERIDGITGL